MSRMKRFVVAVIIQQVFLALLVLLWLWLKSRPAEMVVTVRRSETNDTEHQVQRSGVQQNLQSQPVIPTDDNLRRIEGVGPKIAAALKAAGIRSYGQLATLEIAQLEAILKKAGIRLAFPDTWPEQAAYANRADWEGLAAFQATLQRGRRVKSE